jgi:hypothetical protein
MISWTASDTSIETTVTSPCPRDTAITMTIVAKISTTRRRPVEVSNSVQIWEAPSAKL